MYLVSHCHFLSELYPCFSHIQKLWQNWYLVWSLGSQVCCVSLGEGVIAASCSRSGGMLKHKCFPVCLILQMLQLCTIWNDPSLQYSCRGCVYSVKWGALLRLLELWGCHFQWAELNWKTQKKEIGTKSMIRNYRKKGCQICCLVVFFLVIFSPLQMNWAFT